MQLILWIAFLAGHVGLWCAIFNRTHATAWPRAWRKLIERGIILLTAVPLVVAPAWSLLRGGAPVSELVASSGIVAVYVCICLAAVAYFLTSWLIRISTTRCPEQIRHLGTVRLAPEKELGTRLTTGTAASLLRMIPGNQVVQLSVEKYEIRSPSTRQKNGENVPTHPEETGIRIAQISDLHFTGSVRREYFEYVMDQVNDFQPDLVFVTGDIVDEPECLDWIDPVFSRLRPRAGSFYILGNHDRRIRDERDLRSRLAATGLIQASGRWHLMEIRGHRLAIAGNELPWYRDAHNLPLNSRENPDDAFRILLSHSPDQIEWAVARKFDLVFAGHTHGGQIRLPVVGPIIAPSRYGVRYASGDFQVGNTLMHVSRGISGDDPVRIRCPPELGLFELRIETPRSPD